MIGVGNNSGASIMIYFVALAVTGIAEASVLYPLTPTAQAMLAPEDMGIGTSLVNFANFTFRNNCSCGICSRL
mgnify:CR=1 FL=1